MKHAVFQQVPNGVNTALKLFGDKLGNLASDMSFMRGGGSTARTMGRGNNNSGRPRGKDMSMIAESRDPRDRNKASRCDVVK